MTWVPPAYRQPGEEGPPKKRHSFTVAAAVATGISVLGAVFLTRVVSWLDSVCGDPAAVVAAQRGALRLHLTIVWMVAAGVPAFFACLARARSNTVVPWLVAAVVVAGVGLGIALSAQPSTWCLF